jgi:hypothetical protein
MATIYPTKEEDASKDSLEIASIPTKFTPTPDPPVTTTEAQASLVNDSKTVSLTRFVSQNLNTYMGGPEYDVCLAFPVRIVKLVL